MEDKNQGTIHLPVFKLFRITVLSELCATLRLATRNLYARCYVGIWVICIMLTGLLVTQFAFKPVDYFLVAEAVVVAIVCCTLYLILKTVFADLLGVFAKSDFKSCFMHNTGMILYYKSKEEESTYSFDIKDIQSVVEYPALGIFELSVQNVVHCTSAVQNNPKDLKFEIPMKLTDIRTFRTYLKDNTKSYKVFDKVDAVSVVTLKKENVNESA